MTVSEWVAAVGGTAFGVLVVVLVQVIGRRRASGWQR